MDDDHDISVIEAELLSVTSGKVEGKPVILMSMRLEPEESFEFYTIALSAAQARRLLDDLTERFRESALLKDIGASDVEAKEVFERIMRSEAEGGSKFPVA